MTPSGSFPTGSCPDMAMRWEKQTHPHFGECLYITNEIVELIAPLSYGIRIGHFALFGGENVFYEQPKNMTDLTTPEGWRLRGGHRLWVAPESNLTYYPDNAPIHYEICGDSIVLTQQEDPWLQVKKSIQISFGTDASVQINHCIENTGAEDKNCSLWAVSAMAPGGVQHIPLKTYDGGAMPRHWISMWSYTDLGDHRAKYSRDEILLTHEPIEQRYKIGVDRPNGPVRYENKGVAFEKEFPVSEGDTYPDKDVSYETFMCKHMVEIESLSPLVRIPADQKQYHSEVWRLTKLD